MKDDSPVQGDGQYRKEWMAREIDRFTALEIRQGLSYEQQAQLTEWLAEYAAICGEKIEQ